MVSQEAAVKVSVSTVTPVFAGERYLAGLLQELGCLRSKWDADNAPVKLVEAIFVDDGAIDGSGELLDSLAETHAWIRVIHLSRNFGQHPATVAGILHSSGDWVVTLDEDLQHRPSEIHRLFVAAASGRQDVVYARGENSVHQKWYRDLSSMLFKRLMSALTGDPNIRFFNSFRLLRGSVARGAASVCSHETYFDMALSWFTQRIGIANVVLKDQRVAAGGASGYSVRKLLSHARRMGVSTQTKFLRIGALVGAMAMLVAIFYGGTVVVQKAIMPDSIAVKGWPSLFFAIVFFGGIAAFLLGIVLEYLSILLMRAQGKPTFFTVDRSGDAALIGYFGASGD